MGGCVTEEQAIACVEYKDPFPSQQTQMVDHP